MNQTLEDGVADVMTPTLEDGVASQFNCLLERNSLICLLIKYLVLTNEFQHT